MQACPTCKVRLDRAATSKGAVHLCHKCGGRAVSVSVLKKTAGADFLRRLRHKSSHSVRERAKPCPLCARAMAKVDFGRGTEEVVLDVCGPCQIVWFDPGEYAEVAMGDQPPTLPLAAPAQPPGPGDDRSGFALTGPDHMWQMLPAVFGMPIEFGPNRLRCKPVVTWVAAAAMAAVFLLLLHAGGAAALADAIARWGLIPARWARHGGLTLLTSFFLHVGWLHLIGNAYFLLIFGDNVEDHLGVVRFVLLLAAAHLGGLLLHSALTRQAGIPCVGASAGISGVIAYYAIVFPRAKIGIFGWIFTLFRILRMPALAGLVLYAIVQIIGAYFVARGAAASVGYLAHIGGLAVGAAAGLFAVLRRDEGTS